jgi:glycosyltransferase involved in cell wall biosynthesis
MEKINPLVSIIVITYNQEHLLAKTLDALLAQQCDFQYEIIIGDDCSIDGTREIIRKYAKTYSCVRYIFNENNLGLVRNYISTISHACGTYIAMCDGDDIWVDEYKLAKQVNIMEKNPDIGLVYTDVIINAVITGEKYRRYCLDPEKDIFTQLLKGNFITISTACFRSSLLQYINFQDFIDQTFRMQDYPMWLVMCHHCQFYHIAEPMVSYLIDHKIVKSDDVMKHACDFDANTTKIRLFYLDKYPKKTNLTKEYILDQHYKMQVRSGLHYNDRKHVLDNLKCMSDHNYYEKRLLFFCKSIIGFYMYQLYRLIAGKRKTNLEMYFGN